MTRHENDAKRCLDGSRQHRQRIEPSVKVPYRVREKKRFHIDDPIPESLIGARGTYHEQVAITA